MEIPRPPSQNMGSRSPNP